MPPKKKLCRSKDQRSIIEVFRGSSDESENSSNDQTKPTKGRNRLLVENQHKLMRVKMTADIDYEQVIQIWRQKIGGFIKQSKNHLLVGNVILRVILTLMFVHI